MYYLYDGEDHDGDYGDTGCFRIMPYQKDYRADKDVHIKNEPIWKSFNLEMLLLPCYTQQSNICVTSSRLQSMNLSLTTDFTP